MSTSLPPHTHVHAPSIQVCGTDRVTYSNICELRSQSGNARMDHMGRCDEGSNRTETVDDMCDRVRRSGRCAYTRENCSHRVQPEEGCCPVCGRYESFGIESRPGVN